MAKATGHRPSEYGGSGAPATTTGIVTEPKTGQTYSEVKVGDRYTDTTSGKCYRVSAVTASAVTWVDMATP